MRNPFANLASKKKIEQSKLQTTIRPRMRPRKGNGIAQFWNKNLMSSAVKRSIAF